MCIKDRGGLASRQRGLSLIELVLFIVVVSIAMTGVLLVMNVTTARSADPLPRKQALAIAEAMLEEVQLMRFTACEPDAFDGTDGSCTTSEAMGPEAGETRGSLTTPFDNVNDYDGFQLLSGAGDIGGSGGVVVPAGFAATVSIVQAAFGPGTSLVPAADGLRITVSVTFGNDSLSVEGYRARYTPDGEL